jgi:hypothetical protein
MPAIRTPRIVRPGVLSNLKPSSITALLSPFADYFAARGAPLDQIGSSELALEAVVSVIASPVESTPSELVERLELLDLISDPQSGVNFEDGYEALVARHLEGDDTAEDLAVKILIHAPDVAWREFDRQALQAKRSLVSFASNPSLAFRQPTPRRITQLENLLRPWFEQNARSGICRVHVREEPHGTSFVIRHGDLLKRIGVFDENGSPSSKILRPERVDVAHFRPFTNEWQISGIGRRLQELYRQAFGTVFHTSASALVHSHRYSLEPLREGPSTLNCDRQGRIQYAHLASLKVELPSGTCILLSRGDIFAGLAEMNPSLLQTATLLEARIDLKLAGRRRLVPVVLNPVRDKVCGIHLDHAIEPWLAERGFSHGNHETLFLESA